MDTVCGRRGSGGKAGSGHNGAKSSAHPSPAPTPLAWKEGVVEMWGSGRRCMPSCPSGLPSASPSAQWANDPRQIWLMIPCSEQVCSEP